MVTLTKNVNNFQAAKVQRQGVAFYLIFCLFQPAVAYKSVTYKKVCNRGMVLLHALKA